MGEVDALESLESILGDRLAIDVEARRATMTDSSWISPIIKEAIPATMPDAVARPVSDDELTRTVEVAHRARLPLTIRGKGTTNYGQSVPFAHGLVLDTTSRSRILDVGSGWIRAEAGATFVRLNAAAAATGQELAMHPSTVNTTVGGFVGGGSQGAGSVEHGFNSEGFVQAMRVLPYTDDVDPIDVEGVENTARLVGNWGTTGIVSDLTLLLVPARRRVGFFASFGELEAGLAAAREILTLDPPPRMMAVSDAALVDHYPDDPALVRGRVNLRALIDEDLVPELRSAAVGVGGRVEAIKQRASGLLLSLTNNHSTVRIMRANAGLCHISARIPGMENHVGLMRSLLADGMLQYEATRFRGVRTFSARTIAPYPGAQALLGAMDRATAGGIVVRRETHEWKFGGSIENVRAVAPTLDPDGLLNPGKLPLVPA